MRIFTRFLGIRVVSVGEKVDIIGLLRFWVKKGGKNCQKSAKIARF